MPTQFHPSNLTFKQGKGKTLSEFSESPRQLCQHTSGFLHSARTTTDFCFIFFRTMGLHQHNWVVPTILLTNGWSAVPSLTEHLWSFCRKTPHNLANRKDDQAISQLINFSFFNKMKFTSHSVNLILDFSLQLSRPPISQKKNLDNDVELSRGAKISDQLAYFSEFQKIKIRQKIMVSVDSNLSFSSDANHCWAKLEEGRNNPKNNTKKISFLNVYYVHT